jgi:hypothetical protein
MTDSTASPVVALVTSLLIGLLLATAVGWGTLVLGGRTDAAGRMGLALGAAVFALVAIGWGRGRRGWLWGLAAAMGLGGALLAHFWSRLGELP